MNNMDRERFRDLMDAYALDALTEEERGEFEAYMEAHPEAQAEVEDLQSIAGLLALSPVDREPPPELKRRLMQAVEAEAGPVRATLRGEERRAMGASIARWLGDLFSGRNVAVGLAAALLVGLVSWNALLRSELEDVRGSLATREMQTMQFAGEQIPEDASAEVLAFSEREAVLVAEDLPDLEEGQTLQIWVIDEEDVPHPAGIFEPKDGVITVPVDGSLEGARAIAVTVEPEGGSEQPTTDPMMTAEV